MTRKRQAALEVFFSSLSAKWSGAGGCGNLKKIIFDYILSGVLIYRSGNFGITAVAGEDGEKKAQAGVFRLRLGCGVLFMQSNKAKRNYINIFLL